MKLEDFTASDLHVPEFCRIIVPLRLANSIPMVRALSQFLVAGVKLVLQNVPNGIVVKRHVSFLLDCVESL